MSTEQMEKFQKMAAKTAPIDATIKFVLGGNIFHIDGTGDENIVSGDDKPADCIITMTQANFEKLIAGKLNPMMAVMGGQIKIKGDMTVAMKLQGLLG